MKTISIKKSAITKNWWIADAEGKVLGRFASEVAQILRGKHKVDFTPHMDMGDFVVVVNAEKIIVTGKKETDKKYFKHTGYPGGIKESKFIDIIEGDNSTFVIRKAVQRMMNSNALAKKQLSNLRVFKDEHHNLDAQKPVLLDFGSENKKNKVN